jgi:hypothetical protein
VPVLSKLKLVSGLLLTLCLLSGVIIYFATVNGPLGYSDSVAYLVSARNLTKGLGLGMFTPGGRFVTTYLHPPLYSLLLSSIGIWGVDLVDAARWCNILLGMAVIFTTGYIFLQHSHYPEIAIFVGVLTISFPLILAMFVSAMSETLFLFLLSLSCLLLIRYLQKQTAIRFITAALICGLLPVTRYVGVAVIVPAVVCIIWFSQGVGHENFYKALVFGLIASIPLVIWLFVLYFGANQTLGGRSIQVNGEYLSAGIHKHQNTVTEIFWNWIPFSQRSRFQIFYPVRSMILLTGLFVMSMVLWLAVRRLINMGRNVKFDPDVQLSVFFGVGIIFYSIVLMATWLFTVPQTPVNDRLLMPVYFLTILGIQNWWAVLRKAFLPTNLVMRLIPWLLTGLLVYWYFPQAADVITRARRNDTVLAEHWRDSQVIYNLLKLPAGQVVVSNKSEAVVMWADRPAHDLMENLHTGFVRGSLPYGSDELDSAQKAFQDGAVLVIFSDFPNQFESTYRSLGEERLATLFNGLEITGQYSDGVTYLYPGK